MTLEEFIEDSEMQSIADNEDAIFWLRQIQAAVHAANFDALNRFLTQNRDALDESVSRIVHNFNVSTTGDGEFYTADEIVNRVKRGEAWGAPATPGRTVH